MTPPRRFAIAAVLCLGLTTSACSGSDNDAEAGPPTDATATEFCDTLLGLFDDLGSLSGSTEADRPDAIARIKTWGEELATVGTPEGISDDARRGFEETITLIEELPDDADQGDIGGLDDDLTAEQEEASKAFDDYVLATCQ